MAKMVKAPNKSNDLYTTKIFMAGTIDNGDSFDWQSELYNMFSNYHVTFYNPRRDDWDSTWTQSIHDKQFNEQVNWELDHLESSDIIVFHFEQTSKSPITLLELGYLIKDNKKIFISCPDGFWRKGNVEILAYRNGIAIYNSFDEMAQDLSEYIYKNQ